MGELSRLTVLSGGSESAGPECGITRRYGCSSVHFVFILHDKNKSKIFKFEQKKPLLSVGGKKPSVSFLDHSSAIRAHPVTTLGLINGPNPPSQSLPQSHSNILNQQREP